MKVSLLLILFPVALAVLSYQPARSCTGGPRQGLIALRDVIRSMPQFSRIGDAGIYNCRNARGGSSFSEHAEGRAWDASHTRGEPQSDALAALLVANADALGVQSVIHNRRVWGYGRWSWRAYTGVDPHDTHVHVGMNIAASNSMTKDRIRAILSGGNPPPPVNPPPVNPPPRGLCAGAANIRCCFQAAAPPVDPAPQPQPPVDPAPVDPPLPTGPTCTDGTSEGVCIAVTDCPGTTKRGLCAGPASIRCCFAPAARARAAAQQQPQQGEAFPAWAGGAIAGALVALFAAGIVIAVIVYRKRKAQQVNVWKPLEAQPSRTSSLASSKEFVTMTQSGNVPHLRK